MVIHPKTDRKYAPPVPEGVLGAARTKDNLHEWSIYRQNLTSAIADDFLGSPPGVVPSPKSEINVNDYYMMSRSQNPLPYGEFQMHDSTVEGVLNQGRQEDMYLGDRGDIYLRFGLPRVAVQQNGHTRGEYSLQRPGNKLGGRRKAQSEMDLRPCGPLFKSHGISMERGLDQIHSVDHSPIGGHYARSDVVPNNTPFEGIDAAPTYSGAFLQSKRHHAHYFSNLDLFSSTNSAYNYLRYAKAEDMHQSISKTPHLVAMNVGFERDVRTGFDVAMLRAPRYKRLLNEVSFEAFGGETVAIMHTSAEEIKALFGIMSRGPKMKGRADGSFVLNGIPISFKALSDRVAYVDNGELYSNLTVKQHLALAAAFIKPATNAFRTKHMVSQLIQTLALSPFHNRTISEIGRPEKQRVKIACQILLDTDIILLDNITECMDLYDSAFMIDYLRDWATKLNRIVIMAINPPTSEMLAMFYKATLIASGQVCYFGRSQQMLNYFESLDYPCPLFKNPCDYYVDLVTHDNLTMEAAGESTERIRRLADIWRQKSPSFTETGPPAAPPPKVKRTDPCTATFRLYQRFWYLFLNNPWEYFREVLYSLLLSVILGMCCLDLTVTRQAGINDRFGLFYILLTIFLLPNLWINIGRVHDERHMLFMDSKKGLYSKISFLLAKIFFEFPLALITYVVYCVPLYFMCGLQTVLYDQWPVFGIYTGVTVLYCLAWRFLSWLFAYTFNQRVVAATIVGLLMTLCAIPSGLPLHPNDQWLVPHYIRYGSPTQWTYQILTSNEFYGNVTSRADTMTYSEILGSTQVMFKCDASKVKLRVQGGTPIDVITTACSTTTGAQAYRFANLSVDEIPPENTDMLYTVGLSVVAGWALVSLILCFCMICCNHKPNSTWSHRD